MALFIISLLTAALLACSTSAPHPAPIGSNAPDLILHNAAVYTLDPANPWADAVAIRGDELVAVGGEDAVLALASPETEVINVEGSMILPGLQDPHLHVIEAGLNREVCFLEPGLGLAAYERKMRACARRQADAAWVRAAGPYADDLLAEDELPIQVLDRAVPSRPALVLDAVGHAVWVNSRALEALGSTRRPKIRLAASSIAIQAPGASPGCCSRRHSTWRTMPPSVPMPPP
ncbi:MAG: amidohydrolase family protein [Acidobacteriota bacterium]